MKNRALGLRSSATREPRRTDEKIEVTRPGSPGDSDLQ
jgi:hypothetical protein